MNEKSCCEDDLHDMGAEYGISRSVMYCGANSFSILKTNIKI